ncbi:hypothetical protein SETIT_3G323000v2 [Setaria italica]|uniref:Uncharacterized protein n=1 Tax=Setaria italica TaxID=4555 RepID=A0A368QL48_SETIT|nr:hypothetical protein SETIT_3G323000v2 [Setaria italica]
MWDVAMFSCNNNRQNRWLVALCVFVGAVPPWPEPPPAICHRIEARRRRPPHRRCWAGVECGAHLHPGLALISFPGHEERFSLYLDIKAYLPLC